MNAGRQQDKELHISADLHRVQYKSAVGLDMKAEGLHF